MSRYIDNIVYPSSNPIVSIIVSFCSISCKINIFKGELKDKEIPGSKLGTTLAHDVVHELALLTDERGLIDAKSFVDVYVFFYIGFHTQISSIKLHSTYMYT